MGLTYYAHLILILANTKIFNNIGGPEKDRFWFLRSY